MAVFPFTVRATDSEGSYADRQFNITVRNSRVERFMVIDDTNAWTSPDGTSWTQRVGQGGFTCAYGNGFWLILKAFTSWNALKSTDGINYNAIDQSSMVFLDDAGEPMTPPAASFDVRFRLKFWNGKFYIIHQGESTSFDIWSTSDGVTWKRKRLYKQSGYAVQILSNAYFQVYQWGEDNGTLFVPLPANPKNPDVGYTPCMGWKTEDGETFTPVTNSSVTNNTSGCFYLNRFNGLYVAQYPYHNNNVTTGRSNCYVYSTDGLNWTVGDMALQPDNSINTTLRNSMEDLDISVSMMYYVNGLLYCFINKRSGYSLPTGEIYLVSSDGLTWTQHEFKRFGASSLTRYIYTIFKNGLFLATSSNNRGQDTSEDVQLYNNGFRISVDGENWTEVNTIDNGTTVLTYNDLAAM